MSIKFRFLLDLDPTSSIQVYRLYKKPWFQFKQWLFGQPKNKESYLRISRIRSVVRHDIITEDVLDLVSKRIGIEAAKYIFSISVIFDHNPFDFKIFTLGILGLDIDDIPESLRRDVENMVSVDTTESSGIVDNVSVDASK